MTKKHFVAVAKILSNATDYHYKNNQELTKVAKDMLEVLIYDFDDYFMETNPLYNSEKFLTACGIEKLRGY